MRDEASREVVFSDLLNDGDCMVMGGATFQTRFKHRVPKMVAKRDGVVGRRINLTIRKYCPLPPARAKRARRKRGRAAAAAAAVAPDSEHPPTGPPRKRAAARRGLDSGG